jgi:diguanylate cyclase (GGDEF)-like protein/PAS domain S-box-containing protein
MDAGSEDGALMLLFAAACVLGLVTLAMPMDPEIDVTGQLAVAVAAGAVAGGLWLVRGLPAWAPMALVATGTVMTTAGIHYTAGVPSSASLFYVWIALFSFYFLTPRRAAAQMALIGGCYAAVIVLTPPPFPAVAHWVGTVGTLWMAGWLVGVLKRRLTRTELEAAHILDTTHDAFVSVDEKGTVLAWNATAQALFGWSAQQARGRDLAGLILPVQPRDAHREALADLVRAGDGGVLGTRMELEALHRAGHRFPVELTISAGGGAGGPAFHAFIRDVTEHRRTQQLLAAQYEVTRLLAEAPDWEHVEARLLGTLGAALGRPMAGLWIWEEELGGLRCSRTWCAEGVEAQQLEQVTRAMRPAPGVGLAGQVWSAARPVWVADVARDEHFLRAGAAVAAGLNSVVAFPVTHDGRVVAVVELYAEEIRLPEGPLLDVLGNIGAQIGQFLVRRRAQEEMEAQTRDLARVVEATRALAHESDPERMAPAICSTVREVAGTLTATLWRADGPDALVSLAAAGLEEHVSLPGRLASTAHGALEALRTGRPVFVPDARGDPRCVAAVIEAVGCASVHFEPVISGHGPLGVLAVTWAERHERLPPRMAQVLRLLAGEAADLLERAELLSRLEGLARLDPLTGLANRRVWDERLPIVLADAARTGRPVALALLDLDHFKAYNDRFGHQVGDRLLRGAAAVWQRDVRAGDLLARYGGEEFGLMMPACDLEAASALLERLRRTIPDGMTCSAGLVVWDGLEAADGLVARADGALYAAKHAGRDQIVAA